MAYMLPCMSWKQLKQRLRSLAAISQGNGLHTSMKFIFHHQSNGTGTQLFVFIIMQLHAIANQ